MGYFGVEWPSLFASGGSRRHPPQVGSRKGHPHLGFGGLVYLETPMYLTFGGLLCFLVADLPLITKTIVLVGSY